MAVVTGILVGFLDHMVGVDVVGAHIIITGGLTPPVMTDKIQVTTLLDGILVARTEVMGGAAFRALKSRIRRARNHFLADGALGAAEAAAEATAVVGQVGPEVGAALALPRAGPTTAAAVGGLVTPRKLLMMHGPVGVVGDVTLDESFLVFFILSPRLFPLQGRRR